MGRMGPMGPMEVWIFWGGPTEVKTEGGSTFDRASSGDCSPLPSLSFAAEEDAAGEGEETGGGVEPGVADGGFPGGGLCGGDDAEVFQNGVEIGPDPKGQKQGNLSQPD